MSTGNPIADMGAVTGLVDEERPASKSIGEIDFRALLDPEFEVKERLELGQNIRKVLIKEGMANLDKRKSMSYMAISAIVNDYTKQELELIKMEQNAESNGALKGLADQVGKMLMNLPENHALPGVDTSGSGSTDRELSETEFAKAETVPGQDFIGVEELNGDDFI